MEFGPATNFVYDITFSGQLLVSGGSVYVYKSRFGSSTGEIDFLGDLFLIDDEADKQMNATQMDWIVRGGTVHIKADLGARDIELLNNGIIKVAPELVAIWSS